VPLRAPGQNHPPKQVGTVRESFSNMCTRTGNCTDGCFELINYRLDKVTGVFLPDKETASEVHVVDLAGVDRHGGKGAAEDAALKAVTRVVDALADSKSHVPYRDSKLTRLIHKSLGE